MHEAICNEGLVVEPWMSFRKAGRTREEKSCALCLCMAGLDDLELHHIVVNSWDNGVDAEQVRMVHKM